MSDNRHNRSSWDTGSSGSQRRQEALASNVIDLSEFAYDGEEEEDELVVSGNKKSYDKMGRSSSDPVFFGIDPLDNEESAAHSNDVASPMVVTKSASNKGVRSKRILDSDDDEEDDKKPVSSLGSTDDADGSGWLERREVKGMMSSDLQANIARARLQHKLISKKGSGPRAQLVSSFAGEKVGKKEPIVESGLFSPEVFKKPSRAQLDDNNDDDIEKQRAYEVQSRLHRLTEDRKRRADDKRKRSRERPADDYDLPSEETSLEDSAGSSSTGSSDEGKTTKSATNSRGRGKQSKTKRSNSSGSGDQSGSDSSGDDTGSDDTDNSGLDWADTEVYVSHIKSKVSKVLSHCGELSSQLQSTIDRWKGGSAHKNRVGSAEGSAVDLIEMGSAASSQSSRMDGVITEAYIQKCCPGLELKPYQLVGINWLRLLHENDVNGVLADDMGLGKTVQTISFLAWIREQDFGRGRHSTHLIVVPASTLSNWVNEFQRFCPSMTLEVYHGSQAERMQMQRSIKNGLNDLDVLLCTYTLFERDSGKPDRKFLQKIPFSYLVLDEAHSIKNSTSKKHDNLRQLMSKHRLLLSGTPVQNDVKELLALLTFLTPKVFRSQDVETLLKGLDIDEKNNLRGTSKEIIPIRQIRLMMAPFVLRRMKSDVLNQLVKKETVLERLKMTEFQSKVYNNIIQRHAEKKLAPSEDANVAAIVQAVVQKDDKESASNGRQAKKARKGGLCKELMDLIGDAPKASAPPAKLVKNETTDVDNSSENVASGVEVVDLSKPTSDMHISNSELGSIMKKISSTELNNLFTALRKAANHPLLLRVHYSDPRKLDLIAKISLAAGHFGDQCDYDRVRAEIEKMSDFELHRICMDYASALGHLQLESSVLFDSPKIVFLKEKLPVLIEQGHRMLVFSQWTRIMDLLEVLMEDMGLAYLRLDGSTPVVERQHRIDLFNADKSFSVFLLSTKAGGLGINLTSADTVILHDLDFNPENDRQAEDRCHRIGQVKPVTVYKLITQGSVDEGIYEIGQRKKELSDSILSQGGGDGKASEDKALITAMLQRALQTVLAPV